MSLAHHQVRGGTKAVPRATGSRRMVRGGRRTLEVPQRRGRSAGTWLVWSHRLRHWDMGITSSISSVTNITRIFSTTTKVLTGTPTSPVSSAEASSILSDRGGGTTGGSVTTCKFIWASNTSSASILPTRTTTIHCPY